MTSASQRCEWQIGDYDYQVLQKEKTLLTPDTKFVIKVIDDADTKISYRSVAKFYSYLCYEDEDFTATFMEAIKSCLNVCDTTCLRPSLRCFTTLLTVQDSLTEFRVKELCEFFTNLMNNSSLYYLEVDAYSAFLLKITSKLDSVKEWILSHKDTWSWVITWLTKHPVPPIGMTQDHIKLQKRRNAAGAPILHNRIHEYKGIASIKLRKFKKMLQDEIEDPKNKWDSDEDLSEHKFVVGEKVDFDPQKTGRWCTAEVEHVLEEMIKVTYYVNEKDQDFQWVSKDIPNIALPNTMTAVQAQIEAESQKFLEVQNNAEQNVHDQDTDHEEGYQKITDGGPENSDHSDTLTPN